MPSFSQISAAFFLGTLFSVLVFAARIVRHRYLTQTTAPRGPANKDGIFGLTRELLRATDKHASMFDLWVMQYGSVFQIPGLFGYTDVAICDPRAVAHILSKDTYTYHQAPGVRLLLERFFGRSLLWAEGDLHKRQRRILSSAFSNAAIRDQLPVFLDSAYKVKTSWDQAFQSSSDDAVLIDVQLWMNRVSLDSIGIAGFSHDFESLSGYPSELVDAFEALAGPPTHSFITTISLILSPVLPWLLELPGRRKTVLRNLATTFSGIAEDLVKKARDNTQYVSGATSPDKSIMNMLIKSEAASQMSLEEVMAQIVRSFLRGLYYIVTISLLKYLLVLAGYETTAASLTWVLIELSRNQDVQNSLRLELDKIVGEVTWDHLVNSLPLLDAVVCESLRLHTSSRELLREVQEDDVIPLSDPIIQPDGGESTSMFVGKGTIVRIQHEYLNQAATFWGPNEKKFVPNRWMNGSISQQRASEIQGHRHILTFSDGPRACLGKAFAITEIKAVLSVLIRNYTFELPEGPTTKLGTHRGLLERPKIAGRDDASIPLVVRRVV